MRKVYKYVVYHGWLSNTVVAEFKSKKAAIAFIEKQPDKEDWCFDRVLA